jgi:hypothetical protein
MRAVTNKLLVTLGQYSYCLLIWHMSGHMGARLKESYCKYLFVLVSLQSSATINLILELHNFKLMQVCIGNNGRNYSTMVPQNGTKYRGILALLYCNTWSVGLQVCLCKVAMYSQYKLITHQM